MVDQDRGAADPAEGHSPVVDMRNCAWIVAILRMMTASSDRLAEHVQDRDRYVRGSRELWDRYRHLIGIYDEIAWALPDPFKTTFTAWRTAFLESGAGDAPIDRARHYRAVMTRFFKWITVAAVHIRDPRSPL